MAFERMQRSLAIACLTRKYFAPRQVPPGCHFYINGRKLPVEGPDALSLVLDVYWNDAYGLRRFQNLATILDVGASAEVRIPPSSRLRLKD